MSKFIGAILLIATLGFAGGMIYQQVHANYVYENSYFSNWTLADKASTISQKSDYIDKFAAALDESGLHGTNDAIIWKTQDNSFDKNFQALQSLQSRLHEIKTMDESSFAYQTAIQQITAQEQGQAQDMLNVFQGCWYKVHHYWLWNGWLNLLEFLLFFAGIGLSVIAFNYSKEESY